MPAARAAAGVEKGLSPICSSMTSLPWPFKRLATARTSNAVSARSEEAKRLNVTGREVLIRSCLSFRGAASLLRRDGLRQRPHDRGDDVRIDEVLEHTPLVAVGLDEVLERLS